MNTHKNANKQGEKILLGGVAAAALGLINAKPQTVKAANQNGNRATKKAASRAVKTKLTYQNETDTETEGETATNDDPAGQNSGSQTAGSENNAGTASSNPAGGSNQDAAAGNTSAPSTTDNAKTEKLGEAVKRDNENPTILTGVWLGVDVTYQPGLGIFTVKGNNQTINTVNDRSTSIIQAKKSRDLLADPLIVDRNQVREVRFEGPLTINGTVQSMFDTLPNLTTVTGLENLNTSNVYSMYGMFANCSSLRSVEGINKLDASKVTDMSYMFENCFKNPKDLISLDLSGLNIGLNINKNDTITMKEMFRGCSKLKSIILPDKIDTSQVTDMTGMFYGCSNLVSVSYPSSDNPEDPANQKVDLSKFNTNSLQYMDYMFSGCTDLTALNIASFDMSKAIKTNGIKNALNNLPNLRKLVLGKNCKFYRNDTNTNVG
ncbi:MAG: BspA family leucine-rich repeat surface protein, partial [Lactobacillus sp.]|nr:BspA family leucine-rich repeat surface protein [Lactobacillus sp.]